MKYTIILLLALLVLTKEDLQDNYSIDSFLNYVQKMGFFGLLNDIKCQISTDVAIDFCKELCSSPHCEELIRQYMTCNINRRSSNILPPSPSDVMKSILENYKDIIKKPIDDFQVFIKKLEGMNFEEIYSNTTQY